MRNINIKILNIFTLIFSKLLFSQIVIGDDFKKIPDNLYSKKNNYQFIIPKEKYQYWKVSQKKGEINEDLIYENKSSKNIHYLTKYSPEEGFFGECLPDWCFSYIVAYKNRKPQYITNEKDLIDFIGYVDNLSEALLISKTYDFWIDKRDKVGSSYKIDKDYIYLYLTRFKSCLVTKESFFIKINRKTQEIYYESNGIYYKSNDCFSH